MKSWFFHSGTNFRVNIRDIIIRESDRRMVKPLLSLKKKGMGGKLICVLLPKYNKNAELL
jgi:hypothetical protein